MSSLALPAVAQEQRVSRLSGPAAVAAVDSSALDLAMAVRKRAVDTNYHALITFAEQANLRDDVEGLSRLQHVINVLIEAKNYEVAANWNRELAIEAGRLKAADYLAVSRINTLVIERYRAGNVSIQQLQEMAERQTLWLPKVIAQVALARANAEDRKAAESISMLAGVIPLIPKGKEHEANVAAYVWDSLSIVHTVVDDVPGFMKAVQKAEEYKLASPYPQPDYEALYRLAMTLAFVGRYDESQGVVDIYRELAERSGSPMRLAQAGNLCGYAAAVRDDYIAVLDCLAPFGAELDVPKSVRNVMLIRRATAYARRHEIALARRDLEELRALVRNGEMRETPSLKRAEAEFLIASGDHIRGNDMLREYHLSQFRRASQNYGAVMQQILVGADEQLKRSEEANQLKQETIAQQRWLVGFGAVVGLIFGVMFIRQRSLSRKLEAKRVKEREFYSRQAEFFTNISHEIRTPLNGVVAMADAIAHTDLSPEAEKMARIIANSSNNLERLLSDFLDSAKMDAGQLGIESEPFDLAQAVADVGALWTPSASEKGVRVLTQMGEGTRRWVMGDKGRLTQVLNNLVSNALKFTDKGRIVLSVVAQRGDNVLFAVTDTGIGFDVEDRQKLFARYSQADNTITRRFGGTGLGLSISHQLVDLMGGELDCDSAPGEGSQFWFEIALPAVADKETIRAPISAIAGEDVSRFLVVDDNATNRTIISMLLKCDNRQLYFAENGQEAVDMAGQMQFDVILMDVQMPVMSGIDAIRIIRAQELAEGRKPATIVILSANADSHHRKEGVDAGADGHIAKPIVLERLLEGINEAIQKRDGAVAEAVAV